ncbi:MAG TPA: D-hexose-6-phosphate mutarotase [Hydrogenophaga sp.]
MPPHCTPVTYRGAQAIQIHQPEAGSATVLLHGGQVVSWIDPAGRERLYLSPLADLQGSGAVRGGVPVIFPQFSARGPWTRHGFARNLPWQFLAAEKGERDRVSVTLKLCESSESLALWPHRFRCELTATLGPSQLALHLTVHNTDVQRWTFSAALHTYLAAGPLGAMALRGLEGLAYEDALQANALGEAPGGPLRIDRAIDRIYFDTQRPLHLTYPGGQWQTTQQGWPDTVVWNPGPEGAQALTDLPDTDHDRFLCVEAALIGTPHLLQPGAQWSGTQTLRILTSPPTDADTPLV